MLCSHDAGWPRLTNNLSVDRSVSVDELRPRSVAVQSEGNCGLGGRRVREDAQVPLPAVRPAIWCGTSGAGFNIDVDGVASGSDDSSRDLRRTCRAPTDGHAEQSKTDIRDIPLLCGYAGYRSKTCNVPTVQSKTPKYLKTPSMRPTMEPIKRVGAGGGQRPGSSWRLHLCPQSPSHHTVCTQQDSR